MFIDNIYIKDDNENYFVLSKAIYKAFEDLELKKNKDAEYNSFYQYIVKKNEKEKKSIIEDIISNVNSLSIDEIISFLKNNIYFKFNIEKRKEIEKRFIRTKNDVYFLEEIIDNNGGNSSVYLIKTINEEKYALKVLKSHRKFEFEKEFDFLIKHKHKNIVNFIDGDFENKQFIIMHLYRNNLKNLLIDKKRISINDFIEFAKKINSTLDYINKSGYIHCDIKADNILFNDIKNPVIADFGCVLSINDPINKEIKEKQGNHTNASPEQRNFEFSNFNDLRKTDIYSAGTLFLQLLSGTSYEGSHKKKMEYARGLSYLMEIISLMTQHCPSNRSDFKIINELLDDFYDIWNCKIKKIKRINTCNNKIIIPIKEDYFDNGFKYFSEENIILSYKRNSLDENNDIIHILAGPDAKKENFLYKDYLIIKNFIVDKNEINVSFNRFNHIVFVRGQNKDSGFFYPINLHYLNHYQKENIVKPDFYKLDDLNNIINSDKDKIYFVHIGIGDNGFFILGSIDENILITKRAYFLRDKFYPLPEKLTIVIEDYIKNSN